MSELEATKTTFPLRAPQMWTRAFFLICLALGGGLVSLLFEVQELGFELELLDWAIPAGALLFLIIFRRIWVPRTQRQVVLHDDFIEIPRGPNTRRTQKISYDQIRSLVPLSSRGSPAVVVDGVDKVAILVATDFADPQSLGTLYGRIMDRIYRLPDLHLRLASINDMAALSQETSSVPSVFTKRFLLLLGAVFAAQYFIGHPVEALKHLYFGANSPIMVFEQGQWWRIATANLAHGGLLHFVVNAFALNFLGLYSERLFGLTRTVVIVLATALAGAAASLLGNALFSVGISTALFGLIGAYLAIHLRFGDELPPPYRQSRRWWIFILGLNGLISIAVPMIDGWAHGGGFVAGLLLGWLFLRDQDHFTPRPAAGRITKVAALLLIALFTASFAMALGYRLTDHPDDELLIAQELERRAIEDGELDQATHLARQWAFADEHHEIVDPVLLRIAQLAIEKSDDDFTRMQASETIRHLRGPQPFNPQPRVPSKEPQTPPPPP